MRLRRVLAWRWCPESLLLAGGRALPGLVVNYDHFLGCFLILATREREFLEKFDMYQLTHWAVKFESFVWNSALVLWWISQRAVWGLFTWSRCSRQCVFSNQIAKIHWKCVSDEEPFQNKNKWQLGSWRSSRNWNINKCFCFTFVFDRLKFLGNWKLIFNAFYEFITQQAKHIIKLNTGIFI